MATIKSMLYPGCKARIIGHTELCIRPNARPIDTTRWPGYDQHNPADIAAHCARLKKLGIDILMFNTYSIGSWENKALELYLPETVKAGLNVIINIDKGVYDIIGKDPIEQIRTYIKYLRTTVFTLPNYEKFGKDFIVTYFVMPLDSPAMFARIERENPDIAFVYNEQRMGDNQMSWVTSGLERDLDNWCGMFSWRKHDGSLYIPHVAAGFNDTFKGRSVWPPYLAARVWPAGIGPNNLTLKKHFDVINRYYGTQNELEYLQLVSVNDWDELTALESNADGSGGYFSYPVCDIVRGEIWVDGKKFGDLPPGDHVMTIVRAGSDNSIAKEEVKLKV